MLSLLANPSRCQVPFYPILGGFNSIDAMFGAPVPTGALCVALEVNYA